MLSHDFILESLTIFLFRWLKKGEEAQQTPDKEDESEEETLPFNARARMQVDASESAQISIPSFKPVDWQQEVMMSDGEDEDDYPISPGVFVPEDTPMAKKAKAKSPDLKVKQEQPELPVGETGAIKEKKINTIPTPLAFLQLWKNSDSSVHEQNKSALSQPEPVGKSTGKTTPTNNNLFTTTPLTRPFPTNTPPLLTPLASTSMSEFVAAIRAEKNAATSDHPYSIGPSFALQPTNLPMPDPPFRDVLSPVSRSTVPSPVPRVDLNANTITIPNIPSPIPTDRISYQFNPYMGSAAHMAPIQTVANNTNAAYARERPNGTLPTPISAVLGPRPPIMHPRSMLPTQIMPYSGLRQIAPAPPAPSGSSLPTPLSAVIRDRPPMPFVSPLTPIFLPFIQGTIPIRTPPLPSPHSDTSTDRQ